MQLMKRFQKKVEDFICEHCGGQVVGNGFTNHCPHCLWSKHVDIDPGDRAASCGGLMEPALIEAVQEGYVITHQCAKCRHRKRNKTNSADDESLILEIAQRIAEA
jgi:hypothetical protein